MAYGLLDEMKDLWGGRFDALNNCQRLWMIQMVSDLAGNDPDVYADHELDDEIFEVFQRVDEEMDLDQKIQLIKALSNTL